MHAAANGLAVVSGGGQGGGEADGDGALLTAAEVAKRLRVSRQKVYALVADGGSPGIRVGGEWRFVWSAVWRAIGGI